MSNLNARSNATSVLKVAKQTIRSSVSCVGHELDNKNTIVLIWKDQLATLSVDFTPIFGMEDFMYVRTHEGSMENEFQLVLRKSQARSFYKTLSTAGFSKKESS